MSVAHWVHRAWCAVPLVALLPACGERPAIDPRNNEQVRRGQVVYERHCAACHGARLEGQPDWRIRRPDGRLPAPPHNASGHTWHHPDDVLFSIVKHGMVPPNAPRGYVSDMPAFGATLTDDEIRAVLAFIETKWSGEVREARRQMSQR